MKRKAPMSPETRIFRPKTCARGLAVLLSALILLSATETTARADGKAAPPLTGKLELRFQRCRSGAPIPIVWEIEWNGQTIVEGDLEYEIEDANRVLARLSLSDVVLSPGKNVFNAMLPALSVYSRSAPVTVRARFVAGKQKFEFEEQSLRVPNRFDQWFNVGVVSGGIGKPSPEETRFLDALRWERLLPPNDARDRSTTVSLDVATAGLPADPLTLCNFDVIVLLPAALAEIRNEQADGLTKWVSAGGSLCLIAGSGLTQRHAALLNELLSESIEFKPFVVDPTGSLAPGAESAGAIISARKGLGRVVMLRQALQQVLKPEAKEWLAASAFLMKARQGMADRQYQPPGFDFLRKRFGASSTRSAAPRATSTAKGRQSKPANPARLWNVQPPGPNAPRPAATIQLVAPGRPANSGRQSFAPSWRLPYDPAAAMRSELGPPPLATLGGLFQILMPRDVQMVPLGLIGIILAAYVVTVGPVDYFLLGLLRMRRLTWILFPVVTLAFAGFTLWLSRWYLGTNDSRQAIEVHDVVKGGTVARRTRIELLFLSRERDLGTEVQNGTFCRVGLGVTADLRRFAMTSPSDVTGADVDRSSFVGRFPNRYVITQGIPQWTPTVNRFFWIDPKPAKFEKSSGADPAAHFDWDDPGDSKTPAGREALAERVRRAFGDAACAVVYRPDGPTLAVPILNSFRSLRKISWPSEPVEMQGGIDDVIGELSFRTPEKLFALASQISPNGSPDMEDLAILDDTDSRQSLLVIGVQTGPDLVLYRRLFVGGR